MKKWILFISILCIFIIILAKLNMNSDLNNFDGTIPLSYFECEKKKPKNYIPLYCEWIVIQRSGQYNQCLTKNGIIIPVAERPATSELDRPNIIDGCKLIYYNPDLVFPENYKQCAGIHDAFFLGNTCRLTVSIKGSFNQDVAKSLFDSCIKWGGTNSEDGCRIIFYQNK